MTTSVESMEVENRYATKNNSSASEGDAIDGAPLAKQENAVVFSTELLQMYYSRLFPFDMLHQWLSYGKQQIFSHREFSFTVEPVPVKIFTSATKAFKTRTMSLKPSTSIVL